VPADVQQQLQPPDYASVPFKLQHLRLEVLSPDGSPRSRCSKGPKTVRSPCKAQSASAPPGTNLAGKHGHSPSFSLPNGCGWRLWGQCCMWHTEKHSCSNAATTERHSTATYS
jgi:hypothetical protein